MYPYYQNYYRGVNTPSMKRNINPLNGKKENSFRTIIVNTEKSIDTISSLIPIYQKVQPLLGQGKELLLNVTNFFKKKTKNEEKIVEKVEAEIVDNVKKDEINDEDYRKNNNYSKPFFNE